MQMNTLNINGLLRATRLLFIIIAIGIAVPAGWAAQALADTGVDATALANEINKNLRAAENDMFNGKNESADQQLNAIAPQIEQLKAADPANPKLKSLESKYAQVRKNLDRKLGGAAPAVSTAAPGLPAKPVAKSMPPAAVHMPAATSAEIPMPARGAWRDRATEDRPG